MSFQPDSSKWAIQPVSIKTRWAEKVDPNQPLPEYPRPQWVRPLWLSLNGIWEYAIRPRKDNTNKKYDGQILVPFAIESALSGVMKPLKPSQRLWYHRTFEVLEEWRIGSQNRLILHFNAVDWKTRVFVNNTKIGDHIGGYTPFLFDITENVKMDQPNELVINVWDETDSGHQERGKQVLIPFGVNYTAVSGIWQTVWLEIVPFSRIESAKYTPDIDANQLQISLRGCNIEAGDQLQIQLSTEGEIVASYSGSFTETVALDIPEPKLWSPEDPFLYDLTFSLLRNENEIDSVKSYCAMRKISLGKDSKGVMRICLNNQPLFQFGPLDQGYWPDGLYTAPTDEALKWDIQAAKTLGFNMIRKHIKVEPLRWYYHCDTLGMLVWQDMPSGGSQIAGALSDFFLRKKGNFTFGRQSKSNREQFWVELHSMIDSLFNSPSVIMWVPFNEAWGQFETKKTVNMIRTFDQTRLINNASGWTDAKVGDIRDVHLYPGPEMPSLEPNRAVVCGEFGGLGFIVPEHHWKVKFKWGYRKFPDSTELQNFYEQLMQKLTQFISQGLSAAVYTQLTDVEGEVNGYLTYDREVMKMPAEWLADIHCKFYHTC